MNTQIPPTLQSVLWSNDIKKLNVQTDKIYIIHQIFCHGTMEDMLWLFKTYSKTDIITIFTQNPYKDYDPARFYFVKNYMLHLANRELNEKLYAKNTPRDTR